MANLKVIMQHYVLNIRPHKQPEVDWFRHQPTLTSAIERAALAVNSEGKRYSHQRRLKRVDLELAKEKLLTNENLINQCKNFDDLKLLLHHLLKPVNGVGELYIYDTAFRIGVKLNLFPTKVYLHAGTRDGAEFLGFDRKLESLEVNQLPKEFQELEPYEIEDVLCIYKDDLTAVNLVNLNDVRWCGAIDVSECS